MKVHERIHAYVRKSGFKQYAIAEKAGYEQKQFSAMLTGKKRIFPEDVERICAALKVEAGEFIKPELIDKGVKREVANVKTI
jgi:transcriptional regulator with XRE-family HTH domain